MDKINNSYCNNLNKDKVKSKDSFCINNKEVTIKQVLECVNKVLKQKKAVSIETLSIYRLEALARAITIKKIMLNCLENDSKRISELNTQLDKFTTEANSLIKEIIKTKKIAKQCCGNIDCTIEWQ